MLAPYRSDETAISAVGPDVLLAPEAATPLALGLHELCTNAVKYGALSVPGGEVVLTWTIRGERILHLDWVETGGPMVVEPVQSGFGTRVLTKGLFGRDATLEFDPIGVRASFSLPFEALPRETKHRQQTTTTDAAPVCT